MANNGSINIADLYNFQNKELGVLLALVEKGPTIVPKIIAQLNAAESGSMGKGIKMWYETAKVELERVP